MLVSYNWLKELVDLEGLTPNEVANKFTFAGVEVENIFSLSNATNLVVGKVIECEDIPNTHLHKCKVDIKTNVLDIVCGASNCRKDLKVIVALVGSKLPGGEIKATTIKGYQSNGMLCSLLELGVDAKFVSEVDLKGIHELDDSFDIGSKDVLKDLGLEDTILNLKLLANRPDLLSIYNVAKEVGTLFNKKVKELPYESFKENRADFVVDSKTNKCPQFSIRIIKGITVKESPQELKNHLIAMGVRPINNIVDIGNYIMLLTGQPLHMYDYDKLHKHELIVKDDNESDFIALDNKTYKLNKGDIVVTSNNEVMCLGGVMGGLNSSDTISTKNIVIEAANFDGASIRRTSTRLNLISESSIRFAHGINPKQYNEVINLATSLIKKYCGLTEVSNIITYDINKHEDKKIKCSLEEINNILGTSYDLKVIIDTLNSDHFIIDEIKGNKFVVTIPSYRIDIDGVNDLAEEVVRILGFANVRNELPSLKTTVGILSESQRKKKEIENSLRALGLYEVLTYVLVNNKRVNDFTYLNNNAPYKLINPMTDDHEYVRKSLLPSLLDVVSYNLAHQNKDFGVFEISDINVMGEKNIYLSIALTGNNKLLGELNKTPYSFYSLKGYLENIMNILGIEKNRYLLKEWNLDKEEMHPTRSATIYIGKTLVGYFGELHQNIYPKYMIKNNKVYGLEINLSLLFNLPVGNVKFKAIPRFPSVTRDLSLLVNKDVKSDSIINIIKKNGAPYVKDLHVFDVYTDESLLDKKSIAISLTMYNENATLKDNEINNTIEKIKAALLKENILVR